MGCPQKEEANCNFKLNITTTSSTTYCNYVKLQRASESRESRFPARPVYLFVFYSRLALHLATHRAFLILLHQLLAKFSWLSSTCDIGSKLMTMRIVRCLT